MGQSAARVTDIAVGIPHCHSVHPWSPIPHPISGPIMMGASTVTINDLAAARVLDPGVHAACCGPNIFDIITGSGTVVIEGSSAARLGDMTMHCTLSTGTIVTGSGNCLVG